jgi:hypothetical protein
MLRKFASLKDPTKYGYAFDSDVYDSKAFFSDKFRQFDTFGDGLCQHSRDWSVQVDFMADYMASLATAMLSDQELVTHARWEFLHDPEVRDIEFAASVVFKPVKDANGADLGYEKTRRYYSLEELKISAVSAKEYDKRYVRVESWCDGSPEAIYRMLVREYDSGMGYYAVADAIRNWCHGDFSKDSKRPYFGGLPTQFLKWFDGDHQRGCEFRYAWNACKSLFAAQQARDDAETSLKNLHWPLVAEEKTETEVSA